MSKSLAQEQFDIKHANEMELATRELARRSHDTIRIFNPTDHVFSFMHDRFWHRVPAKSFLDVDRYLAVHFFKKICDYMIGQQIMVKGQELKDLRERQMGHQYLDHYEENVQVWDRVPKMSDPELIEQIRKTTIIGLVKEYGMELPEEQEMQIEDKPTDFRNVHEQAFDSLDRIPEESFVSPLDPVKPVEEILDPNVNPAKEPDQAPIYVSDKDKEKIAKEKKKLAEEITQDA